MTKRIFLFTVTLFLLSSLPSYAISPTPSQTPTKTDVVQSLNQQINEIKDKIASSVAKLHLVDNRGIIGTVTETTSTALTITDIHNNIRFVDVDQITNFSSPSAKTKNFGISDISKGTVLGVIGKYNKDTKHLLARFVNVVTLPEYISGVITAVDRPNYTISVLSENKTTTLVDIDPTTKTYSYDNDANETKSGFSKVDLGQRVYIVGYADVKEKNRMSATRILLFPTLPANPHIQTTIHVTPTVPAAPTSSVSKPTPSR